MRILQFQALFLILSAHAMKGQLTGSLSVSGEGCGCVPGCNLTALGGPDCGAGVIGNCTAGYQFMSTTIAIPANCQVRVMAQMSPRESCTAGQSTPSASCLCPASGGDGGLSGDRLKVEGSVPRGFQTGVTNSVLADEWTETGPVAITISGWANRADEIITYQVIILGGTCTYATLPVLFEHISAVWEGEHIRVEWETASEHSNAWFTVELSSDTISWQAAARIAGAGTSHIPLAYSADVVTPPGHSCYIRVKQTDENGASSFSPVVEVKWKPVDASWMYDRSAGEITVLIPEEWRSRGYAAGLIYPSTGRLLKKELSAGEVTFHVTPGVYLLLVLDASGNRIWMARAGAD